VFSCYDTLEIVVLSFYWPTVCKTVRPMLSVRCLSVCLFCPVLTVTLMYCRQTVGRIKMKLGMRVSLGPGHIVLHGHTVPLPQRGTALQLSADICCGQTARWIKMPLGKKGRLRPNGHCVRWKTSCPSPKGAQFPQFSAHVYCAQTARWIKIPLGVEIGLYPGDIFLDSGHIVLHGHERATVGTVLYFFYFPPPKKGAESPNFRSMSIVAKRLHGLRCHLVWR